MTFQNYLGLKHKFRADPKNGEGADCLLLCFTLLDEAGVYHPELDESWFTMAEQSLWESLAGIWQRKTEPAGINEPWSVALHWNRPRLDHPRLGICTLVETHGTMGLVMINARKGVCWMPLDLPGLPQFEFRRFIK
jgi:hypothetical protein